MTTAKVKHAMETAGFAAATRSPKRLIANIQSIDKAVGKTRLALTAPKPVGYIAVEAGGGEGVIDHFIEKGKDEYDGIQIANIRMEEPQYPDQADFDVSTPEGQKSYNAAVNNAVQDAAAPALEQFYQAYYASLENMRTTIVDTGSDLYELMRLAEFGRLERVPQLAYGQLNRQVANLFDDAFSHTGNVVWIHHMKQIWKNIQTERGLQSEPTDDYKMDGSKVVRDKVQAIIQLWREELPDDSPSKTTGRLVEFHAEIAEARHFADAIGEKFTDDEITFQNIAMALIPGSVESDWT